LKFLEEISDNYAGMAMLAETHNVTHIFRQSNKTCLGNHLFATNDITVLVCMSRYLCMDVTQYLEV
jgi:hypothetical protein